MQSNSHSISGFTVIEMLLSIAIATLVGGGVYLMQKNIFSQNRTVLDMLGSQYDGRQAMKMISTEVREIAPSNLGAYGVVQVGTSSFTFYSNIDDDVARERVRYFLDGTMLKKGVIDATGTPLSYPLGQEVVRSIVDDIANGTTSIFSYYDDQYDGILPSLVDPINIPDVRLVKVTLIIDRDINSPPGSLVVTTQVSMRNLKDNL